MIKLMVVVILVASTIAYTNAKIHCKEVPGGDLKSNQFLILCEKNGTSIFSYPDGVVVAVTGKKPIYTPEPTEEPHYTPESSEEPIYTPESAEEPKDSLNK